MFASSNNTWKNKNKNSNLIKLTIFIISYVFVIFINNFIEPGAGGVLVGDRDVLLIRL